MEFDNIDYNLPKKTVQQAYHAIVADLLAIFATCAEEYRTYIVLQEKNIEDHANYTFYSPLVVLYLAKTGYWDFHLEHTVYDHMPNVTAEQWEAIKGCIVENTRPDKTATDIRDFVSHSPYLSEGYDMALKEHNAGRKEFQLRTI